MMRNNEREPMNTNAVKKEILAKLLATEDITVVQKNVETASFNLESRTLTLPTWKTMDSDTIDHLTGHEVGHALYTPELEWKKAVENKTEGYRSYLNIVEDARIEKLIQRRYPGLRAPFIRSYNNMLDEGFFGKSRQSINAYDLIDRLNVYFKCGASTEVSFSKEEEFWVNELEEIETFDAAVKLATLLYNKAKEDEDATDDEDCIIGDPKSEGDEETDGSSEYGESGEFEDGESDEDLEDAINKLKNEINEAWAAGDEEAEMAAKDELDDLLNDEVYSDEYGDDGGDDWSSDPKAKTDGALKDSISEKYAEDDGKVRNYYKTDIRPIEKFIKSYKEVLEETKSFSFTGDSVDVGPELLKKFRANNKPTINYLVKEFEMKKQASEYARTTTSKTGVIDPIKMNSYRYSDDIFKKISVIPEGKNHGLLMYLDFSGSMAENMAATIDQTLNLVMFCRQINIPFRVYSFTTLGRDIRFPVESVTANTEDCLVYASNLHIMELFNEKMTRMDFIKMSEALLVVGQYWNERFNRNNSYGAIRVEYLSANFHLGGTPLNDTIMFAMKAFKKFKAENRLDIVNTVFLTDGSSNSIGYYRAEDCMVTSRPSIRTKSFLIDRDTKKTYDIGVTGYGDTNALLTMYRDNTQSNLIGFRILSSNKISVRRETMNYLPGWEEFEDFWKHMNKNKFSSIPNSGYSEWFGVRGGKALNTANTSIQVADDAKKGAIRNAFKKANSNRKASRVMLSKFIDLVA